jgi:inosine triphosphate pyrophosphatase
MEPWVIFLLVYNSFMQQIFLVTGNSNKLREWQQIIPSTIDLQSVDVDLIEIQSDNPEEIVADKARRAYEQVGKPVIVEDVDAGLEILGGLPGPFIKFFNKRLGKDALYKLAGREGEKATVACTAGYYDGSKMIIVRGEVSGTVVAPRGDSFGFDIVFVPDGETQTFAEMEPEKKNSLSHRRRAIELLIEKLSQENS